VQLDADLLRALLLWAEANLPSDSGSLEFPALEERPEREVAYACLMAKEAGFIEAIDVQRFGDTFEQWMPRRLTFQGHQYLETIRDDKIWAKAKEGARKIGSLSLETLGQVAKSVISLQLKKYTGLELED